MPRRSGPGRDRASSSGATPAPRGPSSRRRSRAGSSRPAAARSSAASCRRRRVALLRLDLGVVISASHNPPEYNGVKFFDRTGQKLTDAAELEIEGLLDSPGPGGGDVNHVEVATDSYLEHVLDRFGDDLDGLRIVVDCANGAYSGLAPRAFEELGAIVYSHRRRAGRREHQRGLRRDRPRRAQPHGHGARLRHGHRLRRRRRPDAGGRRARPADRRRPDRRGAGAAPRRRPRGRHDDGQPGLPPA